MKCLYSVVIRMCTHNIYLDELVTAEFIDLRDEIIQLYPHLLYNRTGINETIVQTMKVNLTNNVRERTGEFNYIYSMILRTLALHKV